MFCCSFVKLGIGDHGNVHISNRGEVMQWSRYSHLFQSKRNGWLLYNSASNAFFQLPEDTAAVVKKISEDPEGFDFSSAAQLYMILRSGGFLVEEGKDDAFYNILKMQRITSNYAVNTLMLTIAITRNCNFDCSYCYEGNRTGKPMSAEVAEKVVQFVRKHHHMENLAVTWYGGEPLLAVGRIRELTKEFKAMDKKYSAGLVTNGYLLSKEIIAELNDWQIQWIQITLDGNEATHNSRRYLKNHGETFKTILENLKLLMASDYKGQVRIRVNVDSRNEDEFIEVYRTIQKLFPEQYGENITVYPGFVKGDEHPDRSCFYDSADMGNFLARMAGKYGIDPLQLFPRRTMSGCTLTRRNAYVVGPDGELYKCWDDVGIKALEIGKIDDLFHWNMGLVADGMVAASYLDSEECKACYYFPVCNGGCHKVRMKNLHDNLKRDCCSYFKHNLEDLLELYYEQKKQSKQESGQAGHPAAV